MNHQPNWKPEAPAIPAKLREDGELEEIVRQAIRTKDDVEGRRFERQPLEDVNFGVLQFTGCVFEKCLFSDWEMRRLDLVDCVFSHCEMGNLFFPAFAMRRVRFEHCRMTGVAFAEGAMNDVTFADCMMDYASLAQCKLERVEFLRSQLDGVQTGPHSSGRKRPFPLSMEPYALERSGREHLSAGRHPNDTVRPAGASDQHRTGVDPVRPAGR